MTALNFENYEKQISNFHEIMQSGLKIGYYKNTKETLLTTPEDKYIDKHSIDCDLSMACLNRTAFKRDFATFKGWRNVGYLRTNKFTRSDGKPLIFVCKDQVYQVLYSMTFARGFPMFQDVNKVLIQLKSSGFVYYWYNKAVHDLNLKRSNNIMSSKTLSISEIVSPFGILLFGELIAFVVFLIELIASKQMLNNSHGKIR